MQRIYFSPTIFSWNKTLSLVDTSRDPKGIVELMVSLSDTAKLSLGKIRFGGTAEERMKEFIITHGLISRYWTSLELKLMNIPEDHVDFTTYLYLCDMIRHGWECSLLDIIHLKPIPEKFKLPDFMRMYHLMPEQKFNDFINDVIKKGLNQ